MSNSNTNLQTQTSSVIQNDTVSSCSISNIHERVHNFQEVMPAQVLKKSVLLIKFLSETLQDYGTMPIFKRTFSQDLDLLEQHLTKDVLSRIDCTTTLTNLRTKFENAFNSEFEERMRKYTRYNAQSFNDAMIFQMTDTYFDEYTGSRFKTLQHTLLQPPGKALGQTTNHGKMTSSSSGMIQKLMMHISDPFNDKESNAEVQLTAECNIFFYGQPHNLATEIIVEVGLTNEARKKTQERDRNSKTSVMPFARFQSTADGSKPKPRSNNQTFRSLHVSKSTRVTIMAVPKADHSKSSSSFTIPNNFGTSINVQKEQSLDLSAVDSQMMIQKNGVRSRQYSDPGPQCQQKFIKQLRQ
ncbi:hypothetical protein Tco_0059168 [Tanacetum coccineum]